MAVPSAAGGVRRLRRGGGFGRCRFQGLLVNIVLGIIVWVKGALGGRTYRHAGADARLALRHPPPQVGSASHLATKVHCSISQQSDRQ